ncbi:hypothetical protein [Streptobacillus ratti]|uniref:hypothetical protein n=1 Tax=Streptobacillus ratti TaxID=1720557 RepID=UPI000932CC93|nr:hypothetical protein [Streptobacillus ratti]
MEEKRIIRELIREVVKEELEKIEKVETKKKPREWFIFNDELIKTRDIVSVEAKFEMFTIERHKIVIELSDGRTVCKTAIGIEKDMELERIENILNGL